VIDFPVNQRERTTMPLDKPLNDLDESHLQRLVSDRVAERKTLEYKEKLPGGSDADKKEFLADASSFANAAGGHLIYGMKALDGQPVDLCGLPKSTTGDAEILALEASIRNGIAPRIVGVHSASISLRDGGVAIVIRIPKSFASPHMVTYKGTSRFYSRTSNGKYQLDVGEIRAAFLLSESAAERCRDFRLDRVGKIIANETPLPLEKGPKAVLHIVPITLASERAGLDSDTVSGLVRLLTPVYRSGLTNYRYNFDGIYTYMHPSGAQLATAYLQVFRSGCIETVDAPILQHNKRIPSVAFEERILRSLPSYFEALRGLNIEPPVFVMLSLIDVSGFRMGVSPFVEEESAGIDRENLLCPEVLIEDFQSDIVLQMKAAFDSIWNAAGWPGSLNYEGTRWVMLIRLFQQTPSSSIRACRAPCFRRLCANSSRCSPPKRLARSTSLSAAGRRGSCARGAGSRVLTNW
jgi:hypothetical protein